MYNWLILSLSNLDICMCRRYEHHVCVIYYSKWCCDIRTMQQGAFDDRGETVAWLSAQCALNELAKHLSVRPSVWHWKNEDSKMLCTQRLCIAAIDGNEREISIEFLREKCEFTWNGFCMSARPQSHSNRMQSEGSRTLSTFSGHFNHFTGHFTSVALVALLRMWNFYIF